MKPFNLVSESWIAATLKMGGTAREYSLRDIIAQAHELRELSDASPLVIVGTLRLLLALLYRICAADGQSFTNADWQRIQSVGKFPMNVLDTYLHKYKLRFDLFDADTPFYQTPKLDMETPKSLNCLSAELASGNNPAIWSHDTDAEMRGYTPAQAARLLVAAQSFSLAGLLRAKGRMEGKEFTHGSAFNSAIPPGAALWLSGATLSRNGSDTDTDDNLFVTLMLNLAPQEDDAKDAPSWELDPPWLYRDNISKIGAKGAMDRFTWQSRLVRLLPETENGETIIRRCYVTQGRSADTSPDPMHTYYAPPNEKKTIVRLSDRKAAWRDAHAIFDRANKAEKPAAFDFVADLADRGIIPSARIYRVNVAGIANDQAKVLLWRHDRLSVPVALLADETLEYWLSICMQWAGSDEWILNGKKHYGMARKLRNVTRSVVALYLAPGDRQPDKDDVSRLADALDPLSQYWARLETHFQTLLLDLRNVVAASDTAKGGQQEAGARTWARNIEHEAREAFRQAVEQGLGHSTRAIQAVARVNSFLSAETDNLLQDRSATAGASAKETTTV